MRALPDGVKEPGELKVTAVACPDCCGVLAVTANGHAASLEFACRIGHRFSTEELLIAKKEKIEARLWSAVTVLEQLAALLTDLGGEERYERRRQQTDALARRLRDVLEENRPVTFPVDGALG